MTQPVFDPLRDEPPQQPRQLPPRKPGAPATPEKQAKKKNRKIAVMLEAGILVLGVMLALLLRWGVYETAIVTSGSMEPTFGVSDRVLVDHRDSLHGRWRRGDVIFFHAPPEWGEDELLAKRVVGLPGERVQITEGQVSINGRVVNEPYLKAPPDADDPIDYTVPQGAYFVMGDNRNNSDDSRANGAVEDKYVEGRAARVLWPPSQWSVRPHHRFDF